MLSQIVGPVDFNEAMVLNKTAHGLQTGDGVESDPMAVVVWMIGSIIGVGIILTWLFL